MAGPRFFADAAAFRRWLAKNAASASELVVGFHTVGSGRPGMSWPESVDEALCFGWIDGVRKRIDADRYQIRFTPRRPGSNWSTINIAKYDTLVAEGRMTPTGEAAYARRDEAKSRVYSYEQSETAGFTAAELRALQRARAAWTFFESTPPSYRRKILHWITGAKQAQTRASRFAALLEACCAQRRLT